MTPERFISKWRASTLTERSASQSHFNDLCDLLEVERPTDADQTGAWYCFERGASKTAGGEGWADAWKRGHFGWEYKGKRKNLTAAYAQLQQYAVALENPPLLVVSDMDRIIVHTNWTNTVSETHVVEITDLVDANKRDLLRYVFTDPERLRPGKTTDALTQEVADKFAQLALQLRSDGKDPQEVAHFLNRLIFCMFAEDIGLLPNSLFSRVIEAAFQNPTLSEDLLSKLFGAMSTGGLFGAESIEWFNGGLFKDAASLPLNRAQITIVAEAAGLNWADIDPSIFGTLFERGLDPAKRSQLGAHYTDAAKILAIVEPIVVKPLLAEWERAAAIISRPKTPLKRKRETLNGFLERLRTFRVLDPACGSGNFLYVALLALKDLEHRVGLEAEALGLGRQFPTVGPEVVQGIELNLYAAELARVTIWIGEIQWMRRNGYDVGRKPILRPLKNIWRQDAIIKDDGTEVAWPRADVIIGNPPFLGARKLVPELKKEYVDRLRRTYKNRVPKGADFVCFWFVKAWELVKSGKVAAAGLIATNSISGGSSRRVLQPIADARGMFEVWRDQPWVVDGAAVDVHVICFNAGGNLSASLNAEPVDRVYADLHAPSEEALLDITSAKALVQNRGVAFQGVVARSSITKKAANEAGLPKASFVISGARARELLVLPGNPNGRPNSEVLFPIANGDDITKRPKDRFIVDFSGQSEDEASRYEMPFAEIRTVKLHRARMSQPEALQSWWTPWRPREEMKAALAGRDRFIVTPCVSKHRIFTWLPQHTIPDHQLIAFAKSDDTTFGILQSKVHRLWALRQGTTLQNRPRYTPTTTFATFPFPSGLTPDLSASDYEDDPRAAAIAEAARQLHKLRQEWLAPYGMVEIKPEVVEGYPARVIAVDATAEKFLRKRTMTNLYNLNPDWLLNAHSALDHAVLDAYGWERTLSDDEILHSLLVENLSRHGTAPPVEELADEEELGDEMPETDAGAT